MLNRRNLRIKVMQLLYANQQGALSSTNELEKALRKSMASTFRSYVYNLYLLREISQYVYQEVATRQSKFLTSDEDSSISTRIGENPLLFALIHNKDFTKKVKDEKLANYLHQEIVKNCFKKLLNTEEYHHYIHKDNPRLDDHKEIIAHLYRDIFLADDDVTYHLEELFPSWQDDADVIAQFILRSIDKYNPDAQKLYFPMPETYHESFTFGMDLITNTLEREDEFAEMIENKLLNWELERVATIDMILMKMALAELLCFPHIPVKVTINEYIDISKDYSTPKSKEFINGILDKLTQTLKEHGSIQKRGRGLVE